MSIGENQFPDVGKINHPIIGKDHFRGIAKMVPLTLEQLLEKIDEPVYLYIYDTALDSGWHIIKAVTEDKIIFRGWNTVYVPVSSMGKCFDLYAYPPAPIDREAWGPCEVCGEAEGVISANYCTEDVQGLHRQEE